ncbi:MAG TPA: hypothetical protein VN788_00170 [Verrucomicrobiae bacterium]|nr:hypothetical protein [Verrucomicrobiae bacterium]
MKLHPATSFFLGIGVGAGALFAYFMLIAYPKIKSVMRGQEAVATAFTQMYESKRSALLTCQVNLQNARVSSVMIAEPQLPSDQVGEFFGSILGAFFGHPQAAQQLATQLTSTGMKPRFFINTANYKIGSYSTEGNAAVFYYYDPAKLQWVGPNVIPPVNTLITENPVK